MDATCLDCAYVFRFDAAWWSERGLQPPRRCPQCRAARRAMKTPSARQTGVVARVFDHYVFLDTAEGERYYAALEAVRPGDLPLRRGDPVTFEPDARPAPGKGLCPKAFVVWREEATS